MARLICGIMRFHRQPADGAVVQRMLSAMQPRNKACSTAILTHGPVCLGVLDIVPAEARNSIPPKIVRTPASLVAADIRIFASENLMSASESVEDSVAELLDSRGAGSISSLEGDFVFARWNNDDGSLLLARDHFGARPLQYTVNPEGFIAFASLPSGLLQPGIAKRTLDNGALASLPVMHQPPPGRTFYRDVKTVEAAHFVTVSASGELKTRRYWRLPVERPVLHDAAPSEAATEVVRLLDQAVRRRLPKDGDGAGHLSGGLDSTPIAILAARALAEQGRKYFAYSFQESETVPGIPAEGEAPYVAAVVAEHPNIALTAIPQHGFLETLRGGVDLSTLLPSGPLDPEQSVLRHAAGDGISILLSGWGGDQVVSYGGRGVEGELFRALRWRDLLGNLRYRSIEVRKPLWRLVLSHVVLPQLPRLALSYSKWRNSGYPMINFIAPACRALVLEEKRLNYPDTQLNRRAELEAWWIPYRLETFAQLGAAHGISYSYPMLDLDLIRYVMRLPGSFFRRNHIPRALIRDAMTGILPDFVRLKTEKLQAYPLYPLRIARDRDKIVSTLEKLASIPLVRKYIDTDEVIKALKDEPAEDQLHALLRNDAENTAYSNNYEEVMRLALFLEAYAQSTASTMNA